jgi:two-component system, cell cycle sensor histidine kinase and response regulator CckA
MKDLPVASALALSVPPAGLDERYRRMFEEALIGIYASRPDGTLLWCNASFARILGFKSVDDALGTNMTAVYRAAHQREQFLARIRGERRLEPWVSLIQRRDGTPIHVLGTSSGVFDADDTLVELHGFVIDVTQNAEAEAALKDREQRFRAVFVDASDAMLILDDDRRVIEANVAAATLFGQSVENLPSRRLDDFLIDESGVLDAGWREVLALGEAKREHRVAPVGGGGARLVECSYRAAVHPDRHLCIARDITERRALEERLLQSEKIESVGRLAGGIAHDFNNLLTAILGYTELLLNNPGIGSPERSDLEEIQKAGQRAAALTQQLLAYSRKQVLLPKEVDLNLAVLNLKAMLTRLIRADITLTCDLAPSPAVIRIDPTQLEQVILNLVLNARDALPGGGVVRIEVAQVDVTSVEVPADHHSPAKEYIRLRVIDNGVGITPEVRAHLFEPFFTTKELGKGTGLGLASVYGIVRQSQGFIAVDSEPGAGATFTMHFPAVGANARTTGAPVSTVVNEGSETVLLVEDEDSVRVIVGAVLRRQGYRVLEAATPRSACEIFDQHHAEIDLLLTDVVMPDMNGPALAQRLVAAKPDLRVLFISGYANVGFPVDAAGHVSLLTKPFQGSTLLATVRDVLGRHQGG